MHGGSVTAHSQGAGRGTEFRIRLPLLLDPAEVGGDAPTENGDAPGESLRVLIIEDNRDAAETLDVLLTEWGHDTRVAYDALSGLELANQFHPAVVLLDIGLPQLHGHDVARRIREQEWGRQALLVAITGWGQEADRQRSKAAGIDHHLLKPADPNVLRQLITQASRARIQNQ
jgi:CheY-like chemotaxis protein